MLALRRTTASGDGRVVASVLGGLGFIGFRD